MDVREALGVLGVVPDADPKGLRSAYLSAVKIAHPDKPGGDAERLRRVVEAYDILRSRLAALRPPALAAPQRLEITPFEAVIGGARPVVIEDVGEAPVRLPPGLRTGDRIGVRGVVMIVAVSGDGRTSVIGDHLCLTIEVDPAVMAGGGLVEAPTPTGPLQVRVSRQDVQRGLVRVPGAGLPARGRHARGDLFIRLEAACDRHETPAQFLLRRFAAAWAA